jgi:hypothetical protein
MAVDGRRVQRVGAAMTFTLGFLTGTAFTFLAVWSGMMWLAHRMDADDRWAERGE